MNRQMLIGFISHGHTGVDVPLYADGPNAGFSNTARDNTDIGDVMADAMRLTEPAAARHGRPVPFAVGRQRDQRHRIASA